MNRQETTVGIASLKGKLLLAAATAALSVTATARASEISINIQGSGTTLATTDSAGVVPASNWNNEGGGGFSGVALKDNTGSASGATETDMNGGGGRSSAFTYTSGGGDFELMSGIESAQTSSAGFHNGSGAVQTIAVNGLNSTYTSPSYDVYVYFEDQSNSTGSGTIVQFDLNAGGTVSSANPFTESGGTDYTVYGTTGAPQSFVGTYTQATGTTSLNATVGNYVEFTGLTAGNFTVAYEAISGGTAGVAGIEIVTVPEPASIGILGVLGTAALLRRRRVVRFRR